jgi:hypothetical protein
VSASPSADRTDTSTIEPSSVHAVTSAIPIKNRKDQSSNHTGSLQAEMMPASFPHPPQDRRRETEFGYVQRRVRKTSVDERNVRLFPFSYLVHLLSNSADAETTGGCVTPGTANRQFGHSARSRRCRHGGLSNGNVAFRLLNQQPSLARDAAAPSRPRTRRPSSRLALFTPCTATRRWRRL